VIPGGRVRIRVNPDGVVSNTHDPYDVLVELDGGGSYAGVFATLEQLDRLMRRWAETGECLSGRYLSIASLVVLAEMTVEDVVAAVVDLRNTGELAWTMQPADDRS
jgi:hypothetical protein